VKKFCAIVLFALATAAHAECYMRSSINLRLANTGPKDIQQLVTPDARGQKCVMRYRIHVDQDWQTAEGIGYGATESEACSQAIDSHRAYALVEIVPERIRADNQMVCSDLPEIRVHPVRIGDVIWQSEVDMHTIPVERKDFWYKRSRCRMFVERDGRNQNLTVNQGIICALDSRVDSKWRVIDKY